VKKFLRIFLKVSEALLDVVFDYSGEMKNEEALMRVKTQ
jgi:hypothetical protein